MVDERTDRMETGGGGGAREGSPARGAARPGGNLETLSEANAALLPVSQAVLCFQAHTEALKSSTWWTAVGDGPLE